MIAAAARPRERGFSLVEALVAMGVMLIGLLGAISLHVVSLRANRFSQNMSQASALALDLAENIQRWQYTDTRLNSLATVTATTDTKITTRTDMGRLDAVTTKAQFSELPTDTNAVTANALGASYQGLSGDVNGDGVYEFVRYWNVFDADFANSGTPQGKFVLIVVRWKEPGIGQRQVAITTYRANAQAFFQ